MEKYLTIEDKSFFAECTFFGSIDNDRLPYMEHKDCLYRPVALTMKGAIEYVIDWIQDNPEFVKNNPKAKYTVYFRYLQKNGELKSKNVFSISGKDAAEYIIK